MSQTVVASTQLRHFTFQKDQARNTKASSISCKTTGQTSKAIRVLVGPRPLTMVTTAPPVSALDTLITPNRAPSKPPGSDLAQHHHNLALQVAHNLHYQHRWTNVRIHCTSPDEKPLPRPLLSGLPPQRLYVHPDEQIEILQAQKDAGKRGMPKSESEREWVLPTQLREKWSLRRFGEVFAQIDWLPGEVDGEALFEQEDDVEHKIVANPWRIKMPKRLLLATVDDDSTVVYYIVHDGIVKPRQN